MCDTFVNVTTDGVLFAKNSDRESCEEQILHWQPAQTHTTRQLRCTWIEVEQIKETHAILISRPKWMWGAEMGTNEHGVTIGNEAVFTRTAVPRVGLTSMDLLRLALERSSSAANAVEVITALLERYPQGGICSARSQFRYFGSFLIADRTEAYVLETCAKDWELERVERGRRSISNGLSIPKFASKHGDLIKTTFSGCSARKKILDSGTPSGVSGAIRLMQTHALAPGVRGVVNGGLNSLCVHDGGFVSDVQTTAAWVSLLRSSGDSHWATGTSLPCLSLYKPFSVSKQFDFPSLEGVSYWNAHRSFVKHLVSLNAISDYQKELAALQETVLSQTSSYNEAIDWELALKMQWLRKPVIHASLASQVIKNIKNSFLQFPRKHK